MIYAAQVILLSAKDVHFPSDFPKIKLSVPENWIEMTVST